MTSPAHYANAGLDDSNLPYEILLNIDGVEDEEQANTAEFGNAENVRKRRTLWQWFRIILILLALIIVILYAALLAHHHFYHPKVTPSSAELFLSSPPACNDSIRVVNITGLTPYANELHFNYFTQVNATSPGIGRLWRGDAVISVNGTDVQGNHSDVVWRLLLVNFPSFVTLEVKSCTEALDQLEQCEAKYREKYQKHHYPYRYIDLLRRCELEDYDLNFPSLMVGDVWRGVMYFIHEHQGWFPTTHKKAL
ncbi:hypothetical protein PRIPAC_87998 [Pristionchus pacificus]|uniref:Uncharacterized protein n=1 Tax=Pristionchus pacificus TaxID=54126 RepID=A0A2A6B953_PRIPA|nr:hypothetical protein PRIPAC_87998 [Pristionchus pacificus]|eukprot:PDM62405.1 hypothetical protein PRIPAC_51847 [Pristionchus pacificus]